MNTKLRIAGMIVLICAGVFLGGWGVCRLCRYIAHEQAMIASVKEWHFAGNFHQDGYYYTAYHYYSYTTGSGKYSHTTTMSIPYQVWVPPRDWSEWQGLDAEDVTRRQTRDKYIKD